MASKIGNLSELDNVLCNFEKTNKGVLNFFPAFGLGRLLCKYNEAVSKVGQSLFFVNNYLITFAVLICFKPCI